MGKTMRRLEADPEDRRQPSPGERQLAESRAEIERIFAPEPDEFPRSMTMRFLMNGKGRMVAFGLFAGLAAIKPKLALSLVRFLPLGNVLPLSRILKSLR
jgi:hypothetical protein